MLRNGACAVVLCFAVWGCDQAPTAYTVKIEQRSMLNYPMEAVSINGVSGTCYIQTASGRASQDLAGNGNFSSQFTGSAISCSASASNENNYLTMTITRPDGSVVGTSQTYQRFGLVSVSGQ